jgi:hypothetical protein
VHTHSLKLAWLRTKERSGNCLLTGAGVCNRSKHFEKGTGAASWLTRGPEGSLIPNQSVITDV